MLNTQRKIYIYGFLLILIISALLFSFEAQITSAVAFAADDKYTSALEDLQKDPDFDMYDYPAIGDDYSLKVIQIAESENNELFVYVYQPWIEHKKFMAATSIAISTSAEEVKYTLYPLTLLNKSGVLVKYKVDYLKVADKGTRIYNISEIFREWDDGFDGASDTDNRKDEKAFEVAQKWTAVTSSNGDVIYAMDTIDVVTIKHQWVGEELYNNGTDLSYVVQKWDNYRTISYFVAFSTNYDIDKLYEADLTFQYRDYQYSWSVFNQYKYDEQYGDWQDAGIVTLTSEDTVHNPTHGIFGTRHEWKTIRSVKEFCETESLSDATIQKLQKDEWVLSFFSTDVYVRYNWAGVDYDFKHQQVSEVAILRLKFECKGNIFDLGVVSDKQTSDGKYDNDLDEEFKPLITIKENAKKAGIAILVISIIIIVALLIVGCILLVKFVQAFFGGGAAGGGGKNQTDVNINVGKAAASKPKKTSPPKSARIPQKTSKSTKKKKR